ncbi:hypothetical protein [Streptomyces sp. NPDC001568]|uniref:hypothetical protein n=1 Tax=Streptomyces sp. NPDC001568 TaxID=3364588 RepID=UPI00368655DC
MTHIPTAPEQPANDRAPGAGLVNCSYPGGGRRASCRRHRARDLAVSDRREPEHVGELDAAIGATDHIRSDTARMGRWSRTTQRWIAVHELGHALGLCHKSNGGAGYVKSVMWTDPIEAGFADPQDVDKANYRKL